MFKFFSISISPANSEGPVLFVADVDVEGNCQVTEDSALAQHFKSFYEASRFAALIDYPVVFVIGVIINE